MTIKEFWRELGEREDLERLRIPFEFYTWIFYKENGRFMNVGIDLFQWLLQHASVEQALDRLPSESDEICTIISGIASKLRFMQSLPINFVVVIDGIIKNDKLRHSDGPQTETDYAFEDLYPIIEQQIADKSYIMNGALLSKVVEYLKAANIEYIFAIGDAEIELARLNHLNVIDGIISNDADSFAYGAKLVLRNFSKNKSDNPQTGKGKDQTSNVYVTPISLDLLKKHGLGTNEIMFLALCQGDDYSNGMKSLGIKKAWNLATKRVNSFDVVEDLKRVYKCHSGSNVKQIFQLNFEERKNALKSYELSLNNFIKKEAQTLFGQRHNTEVSLPSDYVIASHFFPYYTKHIFIASAFTGSQNSYKRDHISLTAMSELEWKRYGIVGNFPLAVKRENDLHVSIGKSIIYENELPTDLIAENNLEPLQWFSNLRYPQILDASRTTRNKLTGYDYLVDELGKCYIWKAIVCMEDLELGPDDIYIKSEKEETFMFDLKRYNFKKYQVMVKKRQLFKRYVQLRLYDDDLNPIEEKPDFIWMPDFMFKHHPSAKKLLQDYNTRKLSPKKKTPKKTKPVQTTNLDFLSKSPKSPFKMTLRKSETLDLTGATTISIKHPNEDQQPSSPRKKSKLEAEQNLEEIKAGENSFSYNFDAETSRVLGAGSIDEVPPQLNSEPTKDLLSELQNSISSEFSDNRKEGKVPEKINNERILVSLPVRTEHHRLTIKRGPSDLDSATRLPSVPVDQEHEPDYLKKFMLEKDESDSLKEIKEIDGTKTSTSFTEDSFTDTDGAIEEYLQQIDGNVELAKKEVFESHNDIETIISDDTFSDEIDIEMIEATINGQTDSQATKAVKSTNDYNNVDNDDIKIINFAAGSSNDKHKTHPHVLGTKGMPNDNDKAPQLLEASLDSTSIYDTDLTCEQPVNQNEPLDSSNNQYKNNTEPRGTKGIPNHNDKVPQISETSLDSTSIYDTDLTFEYTVNQKKPGKDTEGYLTDLTFENPITVNQSHQVKEEYTHYSLEQPIIVNTDNTVIDLTLESDDESSIEEMDCDWKFKPEEGLVLAENTDDEELFISCE